MSPGAFGKNATYVPSARMSPPPPSARMSAFGKNVRLRQECHLAPSARMRPMCLRQECPPAPSARMSAFGKNVRVFMRTRKKTKGAKQKKTTLYVYQCHMFFCACAKKPLTFLPKADILAEGAMWYTGYTIFFRICYFFYFLPSICALCE